MRKLYRELLYVPRHGKIREKVMTARVVVTVLVMLFCLSAMSFSAYAYFSYSIISSLGVVQGAVFETTVSVQENGASVAVTDSGEKSKTAVLEAGTTYTVTIKPTERSTASMGYVVITTNNSGKRYHTQQITKGSTVTFYIKPTVTAEVTFEARWGTSVYYDAYIESGDTEELYVTAGETVTLSPDVTLQVAKPTTGTTVTTTASTTVSTTNTTVTEASQTTATTSKTTVTTTAVIE